jgi:transcriptional antiterminator NusG
MTVASSSFEQWYALSVISGREQKVRRELAAALKKAGRDHEVLEIVCPQESVVLTTKNGKRQTVKKLMFPGYLLIRGRRVADQTLSLMRRTPGVLGFLGQPEGSHSRPAQLPLADVERILGVERSGPQRKTRPRFADGDHVTIIDGPMSDFSGVIESVNTSNETAQVMVEIFGRQTPVQVPFSAMRRDSGA